MISYRSNHTRLPSGRPPTDHGPIGRSVKLCPFCRSSRHIIRRTDATAWVECLNCGCAGPPGRGPEDIAGIAIWNNRPEEQP